MEGEYESDIAELCTSLPIFPLMVPPLIEAMSSPNSLGVSLMSSMDNFSLFIYAAISPIIQLAASLTSAPVATVSSKYAAT